MILVSGDQSVRETINNDAAIWGLKIIFYKNIWAPPIFYSLVMKPQNFLQLIFLSYLEESQWTCNLLPRDLCGICNL